MYTRSLLALALVVFSGSPAAQDPEPPDCEGVWARGNTLVKKGTWSTYWAQSPTPGAVTKRLMAGQHTDIGALAASIADGVLTVSYSVAPGAPWELTKADLYVGNEPPPRAAPGQFPYHSGPIRATSHQFSIPLSTFGTATTLYLAAHAEACPRVSEDPTELGSGTLDATGGTLTFPGLTIEVEPGGLLDTVTFEVAQVPQPAALPAGATANGPSFDISLATGGRALDAPVTLRFTGLSDDGNPDTMLTVLHFNEALGKYEPLTLWETADTYAVVESRAFSVFTPVELAQQMAPPVYFLPGFLPYTKGWSIANDGSSLSPGGNCAGMVAYAAWMYSAHPAEDVFIKYENDLAEVLASRAQTTQYAHEIQIFEQATELLLRLTAVQMGRYARAALSLFEDPLYLALSNYNGDDWHAVMIYGYDASSFYVYDPNEVGDDQRSLTWNETGFGQYISGEVVFNVGQIFSQPSSGAYADFQMLYDEAERGYTGPEVTITEPVDGVTQCEMLVDVKGTRTDPSWNQASLYVDGRGRMDHAVNGQQFSFTNAGLRNGENLLIVLVGEELEQRSSFGGTSAARAVRVWVGPPEVDSVTPSDLVATPAGAVGASVQFSAATQGQPTSYLWEFRNGAPQPETFQDPEPIIQLPTAGSHSGTLWVGNECGSSIPFEFTYQVVPGLPELLDFEGIGVRGQIPPIGEFYASRGVHFEPNLKVHTFLPSDAELHNVPSGVSFAFFGNGTSSIINFDADILNRIEVSYAGQEFFWEDVFSVEIWSGPNATGTKLANLALPTTFGSFQYLVFHRVSVPFTGPARSVKFLRTRYDDGSSVVDPYIAFDDFAFQYQSQ